MKARSSSHQKTQQCAGLHQESQYESKETSRRRTELQVIKTRSIRSILWLRPRGCWRNCNGTGTRASASTAATSFRYIDVDSEQHASHKKQEHVHTAGRREGRSASCTSGRAGTGTGTIGTRGGIRGR